MLVIIVSNIDSFLLCVYLPYVPDTWKYKALAHVGCSKGSNNTDADADACISVRLLLVKHLSWLNDVATIKLTKNF